MQSTGHSSMHALSLTSTQGWAMTYVTGRSPPRRPARSGMPAPAAPVSRQRLGATRQPPTCVAPTSVQVAQSAVAAAVPDERLALGDRDVQPDDLADEDAVVAALMHRVRDALERGERGRQQGYARHLTAGRRDAFQLA